MPGPQPGTGYTPTFAMPIIAAPPSGTDPDVFYPSIAGAAALDVSVEAPHRLRIRVANAHRQLLAVNGGTVRFDPATAGGTLVLTTWAVDASHIRADLPGGMPPPKQVFYEGVDAASVRTALDTAALWTFVPEAWIRESWQAIQGAPPPSGSTQAELRSFYLDQVMAGRRTVFVPGGTALGDAAAVSGSSSNSELVLHFTNAGDNALSPVPYIRTMPVDEYGGPEWDGHPLIRATASLPVPLDFYVRFEIYDLVDRAFKPVPAGITVDLMDDDPLDSEALASRTTNADGVVHFGFARQEHLHSLDSTEVGTPDLYFRIHSGDIVLPFAHHGHLPDMWSTKGWRGVDGVAGYYSDFAGTQIGAHDAPAVFRIGLDYHLRLRYFNSNQNHESPSGPGRWEPAPAHISVNIIGHYGVLVFDGGSVRTDDSGEVHGVSFSIGSEYDVSFHMIFQAEDSAINMREMTVVGLELLDAHFNPDAVVYWHTEEDDEDRNNPGPTFVQDNVESSLGTHSEPLIFRITVEERRVALNLLKLYREWSVVVHSLTGGDFPGVGGYLALLPDGLELTDARSFSFPVGRVNLMNDDHWSRGTIIHELSHQLMWVQADFGNIDFLSELVGGVYFLAHQFDFETNDFTAGVEGWAEFVESVFTGHRRPLTDVIPVPADATAPHLSSTRPGPARNIGPPPDNRGEIVEGALCNALLQLFDEHIVGSRVQVTESTNGDPLPSNTWLTAHGLSDRFQNLIWQPMRDLRGVSRPTARGMAEAIEARNRPRWHELVSAFQRVNICAPILTAVAPGTTPVAGGATIELTGRHFSQGARVRMDSVLVASTLHDSQRLTFVAPAHAAADVEVKVVTISHHETKSRTLRYV